MGARILVADDSVTIQKVVELTFSKEDFVLLQARTGEEAIRKAKEERPDLVLLDLVMPDKTGYEVCAALRADPNLRAVPIILLAGTFEAFDKEQGFRAGANDFVTKPFESQVLIGKVKQQLFAKTVEVGPPGTSPGADRAVPPTEAPRSAPTTAPPSRPGPSPSERSAAATVFLSAARPGALPTPAARQAPEPPKVPISPEKQPSPPAESVFQLPPPTEELSQEHLWQLLDSTPPLSPAGTPGQLGELSLEGLSTGPAPGSVDIPSLELPSLEPESAPTGQAAAAAGPASAQAAGADVVPFPDSLSLDDLLSAVSVAPTPVAEVQPLVEETPPAEPALDLPPWMESPPLAPGQAEVGQPPVLGVEELVLPTEAALSAPAEAMVADIPELEFAAGALEAPSEALPEQAPPLAELPASLLDLDALAGIPLEAPAAAAPEAGLPEVTVQVEPPAGPTAAPPMEEPAIVTELAPEAAAPEVSEALAMMAPVEAPPLAPVAEVPMASPLPPVLEEPVLPRVEPPAPAAIPVATAYSPEAPVAQPEIAAMRQAVTERVAHELTRELSAKLLERVERVVWEVVPDLAEILITREIERIRGMAEEKQSS